MVSIKARNSGCTATTPEHFVAVAEEANVARAAERVHISQSGISAQVRRLEEQLGAELIDRSRRTAMLTRGGAAALERSSPTTGAVRQAVDDVTGLLRGRLAVGMVPPARSRRCSASRSSASAWWRPSRPGTRSRTASA